MSRTRFSIVALLTLTLVASGALVASPASAATPDGPNTDCLRAGMSTLKSLGLFSAVAKNGIEVEGIGVLSLSEVLRAHLFQPELFQTGGVSVIVPDVGSVPATWCNGL